MSIDQKVLEEIDDFDFSDTQFVCPKCGSRHFEQNNGDYLCHDEYERGCHCRGTEADGCHEVTRGAIVRELLKARQTIIDLNSEIAALKYGWK
jgi:hypothetical protein